MRALRRLAFTLAALFALAMLWGYWHSRTHAAVQISVRDTGLRTPDRAWADPHDVRIRFFAVNGDFLAAAHSIEPQGYILAVHPDADIGDCTTYGGASGAGARKHKTYSECYAAASKWFAIWAKQTATAEIAIGACTLRAVPVQVEIFAGDWWLWWVPLPHVGGTARQYITLTATVDSNRCAAPQ